MRTPIPLTAQWPAWGEQAAKPAGPDVTDEMDMLEPVDTPPGHGHTYTLEFVDGWAAVLQPAGWTTQQADALRTLISQQSR